MNKELVYLEREIEQIKKHMQRTKDHQKYRYLENCMVAKQVMRDTVRKQTQ